MSEDKLDTNSVEIVGDTVRIRGFGAQTKKEFFEKTSSLVSIVPEDEYWELLKNASVSGGGWATYVTRINELYGDEHPVVVAKELNSLLIVVNKDRFIGKEKTLMQAVIKHELAELWILGKLGFSIWSLKVNGKLSLDKAIKISHNYARREEIAYAIRNGFGEELIEHMRRIKTDDLEETEKTHQKLTRRITRISGEKTS